MRYKATWARADCPPPKGWKPPTREHLQALVNADAKRMAEKEAARKREEEERAAAEAPEAKAAAEAPAAQGALPEDAKQGTSTNPHAAAPAALAPQSSQLHLDLAPAPAAAESATEADSASAQPSTNLGLLSWLSPGGTLHKKEEDRKPAAAPTSEAPSLKA